MKTYIMKLFVLLMIVLMSVIGVAGATAEPCKEQNCGGSYELHGNLICNKCHSVKEGAGCVLYYVYTRGEDKHTVFCRADGHDQEQIYSEKCTKNQEYYLKSDGPGFAYVCDFCHNSEKEHPKSDIVAGDSDKGLPFDWDKHYVNRLKCDTCGDLYVVEDHDWRWMDNHKSNVCTMCYYGTDYKYHDKDASSWEVCRACNGCKEPNCDGYYTLHDNRICGNCHSVKGDNECKLYNQYLNGRAGTHAVRCALSGHDNHDIWEEACSYDKGYYRVQNGVPVKICDLCHDYHQNTHDDGTVTENQYTGGVSFDESKDLVNNRKCASCGDIYTIVDHECKENANHEVPVCDSCHLDADGREHNLAATAPEDCEVCAEIMADQSTGDDDDSEEPEEPVCKHTTLINRYFTWLDAKLHRESSVCKDCGEAVEITSSHSANTSWHNGTVCLYCRADANGVKHNWVDGECSVCLNGLNPDDGWYYEDGKKSDFTGLAKYDTGLFYIENGQWQKGLNGLKLIGEDFWFLANGQVQEHHGFALYDGEWFYLDGKGKLDVTVSGMFQYNGKTFLVAAGRLVSEYSGLAQVPSGEWYYVAEGRVLTEFSGVIEWNGGLFQIVNGKLVA